jgi:opacity protein-like surface antigen
MQRQRSHRRVACAVLAAAAAVATAVPVRAQSSMQDPAGNIGVHLGYTRAQDADRGNFLGGAHLEFLLLRWLGVQGAVDYRNDERFDVQLAGTTDAELNVRTIPVTVSGKLYVPLAMQLQPYGLAGAGWYHVMFDYSDDLEALGLTDRTDSTFGWHVGVGAQALVSPRLGLFAEGRWLFVDPDQNINDTTFDRIRDFDFDTSTFVAGINFLF